MYSVRSGIESFNIGKLGRARWDRITKPCITKSDRESMLEVTHKCMSYHRGQSWPHLRSLPRRRQPQGPDKGPEPVSLLQTFSSFMRGVPCGPLATVSSSLVFKQLCLLLIKQPQNSKQQLTSYLGHPAQVLWHHLNPSRKLHIRHTRASSQHRVSQALLNTRGWDGLQSQNACLTQVTPWVCHSELSKLTHHVSAR